MAATADAAERYRADFQAAGESAPAWLADLRKRAMERFAETGFPTARRGNEAWKYTNVSPIANADLGLAPAADISLAKGAARRTFAARRAGRAVDHAGLCQRTLRTRRGEPRRHAARGAT